MLAMLVQGEGADTPQIGDLVGLILMHFTQYVSLSLSVTWPALQRHISWPVNLTPC